MYGGVNRNLVEGLTVQMNRCRELVKVYDALGPVGTFGKVAIERGIKNAEEALGSGNTTAMIRAYRALEECK